MQKIKARTAYNARDEERVGLVFAVDESVTQQHFKDESNINFIVGRYLKSGELDWVSQRQPYYGDASEVPVDLIDAFAAVERAELAFDDLPSEVRKSLDNDPSRLSEWILNPENRELAVKHGLIVSSQETNVQNTEVKTAPSASDGAASE